MATPQIYKSQCSQPSTDQGHIKEMILALIAVSVESTLNNPKSAIWLLADITDITVRGSSFQYLWQY